MPLDDQVRAALAAENVAGAATSVVEAHGRAVLGYLCTLLGDDDAQDAASLWAEDVWRGLPGFRFECSVRSWGYRLAWHAAQRLRRDPYRRRAERLPESAASRLAAPTVASGMAPGSRLDRLRRLREALELEDQTLLVLRIDRELEWEEIAAVLSADGAPVNAAGLRKRFERLKDRLRVAAEEQGLLDEP